MKLLKQFGLLALLGLGTLIAPKTIEAGAILELGKSSGEVITLGNLLIKSRGNVTHSYNPTGSTEVYRINLTIAGNLTIEAGGTMNVSGRG